MSKIEKLINRLLKLPKDFTYDELLKIMHYFEFYEDNQGKTSGSRIGFSNGKEFLKLHKPHPGKILKVYQLKQVIVFLKSGGYI